MGKTGEERNSRGMYKHQKAGKNKNIAREKCHNTREVDERYTPLIEFGTIMIYTCQKSCMPRSLTQTPGTNYSSTSTYLGEQIMLQTESL